MATRTSSSAAASAYARKQHPSASWRALRGPSAGSRTTGRVDLDWEVIPGVKLYHLYMSTSEAPFNWQLLAATTKSRCNADGLVSGAYYWFAVTALGTAGETSMSDPLRAMAAA